VDLEGENNIRYLALGGICQEFVVMEILPAMSADIGVRSVFYLLHHTNHLLLTYLILVTHFFGIELLYHMKPLMIKYLYLILEVS